MNTRIKELRTALHLTLEGFGDRIGVTRAAVSKWENGDRGIADSMVVSICREFGVNEHWLRTGEGEIFEQTRANVLDGLAAQYSLDKEQVSVIENFLDLSPQERTAFLTCMRKVFGSPAESTAQSTAIPDKEAQRIAESDEFKALREKNEPPESESCTTAG